MRKTMTIIAILIVSLAVSFTAFAATQTSEPKNEAAEAIAKITEVKSADVASPSVKPAAAAVKATPIVASADAAVKAVSAAVSENIAGRPLKPSPMQAGEPETAASLLVSAEWLKANRGNVVLVDARPESLYAGGHIPGAVNASWTYFANMSAPSGSMKWGTTWAPATMAKRIGALGINGKKTVVAYCDAGGWGQGGWTLWILRMSGIKNAKILDGGLTAWKKAGGQVTRTKSSNKAVAFSIPQYKPNYLVNTAWINNNLGKKGLAILDVRTPAEYAGKIRPFQEKRAGHLPGAINIEMQEFLTADNKYKTPEEIKAMLEKAGITPDNEIVVYDTAGVRAAAVTMELRYAGFLKSQCYDEGFQAWAGKPELPLEKTK